MIRYDMLEELADYLHSTKMTLEAGCKKFGVTLTDEEIAELKTMIIRCKDCHYWEYARDFDSEYNVCLDCVVDYKGDYEEEYCSEEY